MGCLTQQLAVSLGGSFSGSLSNGRDVSRLDGSLVSLREHCCLSCLLCCLLRGSVHSHLHQGCVVSSAAPPHSQTVSPSILILIAPHLLCRLSPGCLFPSLLCSLSTNNNIQWRHPAITWPGGPKNSICRRTGVACKWRGVAKEWKACIPLKGPHPFKSAATQTFVILNCVRLFYIEIFYSSYYCSGWCILLSIFHCDCFICFTIYLYLGARLKNILGHFINNSIIFIIIEISLP